MAAGERQFEPFHGVLGKGIAVVLVRFATNGSSDPVLTDDQKQGGVKSITHTGTGAYTIQLDQKYAALVGWHGSARMTSGGKCLVEIIGAPSLSAAAGATIPIVVSQESAGSFAAADLAADADNQVSVVLFLSKSSLTAS